MSDIKDEETGHDIIIAGPEEDESGTDTIEPIVHICHVYRIDFEDGTSREYVAMNDIAAIYLAEHGKPGVVRLQISRVRKNISVVETDMAREGN